MVNGDLHTVQKLSGIHAMVSQAKFLLALSFKQLTSSASKGGVELEFCSVLHVHDRNLSFAG